MAQDKKTTQFSQSIDIRSAQKFNEAFNKLEEYANKEGIEFKKGTFLSKIIFNSPLMSITPEEYFNF